MLEHKNLLMNSVNAYFLLIKKMDKLIQQNKMDKEEP